MDIIGLDVYLYNYSNKEEHDRLEQLHEEKSNELWKECCGGKDYNDIPEEDKNEYRRKLCECEDEIGFHEIDNYGDCVELPSKKYPDELFKIGYFRSSYNGGGLNRVMQNAIGMTLYDIFPHSDDYSFMPDWDESKVQIDKAIRKFRKYIKEDCYTTMEIPVDGRSDDIPTNPQEAIALVKKEKAGHTNKDFMSYTSNLGSFCLDKPMEVVALVKGKKQYNFSGGSDACIYAVVKTDLTYYLHSLEIVRETITYVLKNEGNFYLHWSS